MSPLMLSVLLSLVSAVAYAGAALVQERVAATTTDADGAGGSFAPLHRGSWWASVVLNCSGALLHMIALAYGPLSLVQPLGALTIVFALPMAALFLGRRAGRAAWRGALLSTVGLVALLALVDPVESQALGGTTAMGLAVATVAVLGVLTLAGMRIRHAAARSVTLAVGSGAAFGMASVFTKDVTADFTDPLAIGMIAILAPAGLLLSQAAYRGAGLSAPLATLTVVNPVIAAAVGVTALNETVRYGVLGALLAVGAGVVAAAGLIELTVQAHRTPPEEPATEPAAGPDDVAAAPVTGRVPAPAAPPEQVTPPEHVTPAEPAASADPVVPVPDGPGTPPGSVPAPTPAYHAGAAAAAVLYETAPAAEAGTEAPETDVSRTDASGAGASGKDAPRTDVPGTDASRTGVSGTGASPAGRADAGHTGPRGPETGTPDTPAPHTPAPGTPAPRGPAPENAAPAGPSPAVAALILAAAAASGGAALAPHHVGCSRLSAPPGSGPATATGAAGPVATRAPADPAPAAAADDTDAALPPCGATAVSRWPHAPHHRDRLRPPRRGPGRVFDGGSGGGGDQWGHPRQ
ncbi:DMT family transporter [Streptomyces sp. WMMC500]|uniref:DMT family transporter n=1 Tax=Streptomyces sp. WMMC500 TaxID=3015154 RepID=UPI00248C5629|nr:DMT family transporter [Streptomyces sp. WMMC500]WBB58823.1 DMT family transporter [Streptomyces sp. WMMC500]